MRYDVVSCKYSILFCLLTVLVCRIFSPGRWSSIPDGQTDRADSNRDPWHRLSQSTRRLQPRSEAVHDCRLTTSCFGRSGADGHTAPDGGHGVERPVTTNVDGRPAVAEVDNIVDDLFIGDVKVTRATSVHLRNRTKISNRERTLHVRMFRKTWQETFNLTMMD